MRITLLIFTLLLVADLAFSQSDTTTYRFVDEMPIFKGSSDSSSFPEYLLENIDLSEIESDILAGRVVVEYCIDTAGKTTDIRIVRSLSNNIDKAVIDAIKNSPEWIPGKLDGRLVKVFFTLPLDIHTQ